MRRKPIIGIVGKPQCDDIIWNKICISNEIKDALNKNGALAIGIIPQSKITDIYATIDLCDGIILEGGIVICNYEQEVAKYCIKTNKPILGICCGCINMALSTGGSISLENYEYLKEKHFSLENMDMHSVSIDRDSKLYNLIKEDKFIVNSIHKCKIDNPGEYKVKGNSEDGIIELLEYEGDNFNIGVQWHPEFITDKEEQNMIFEKFVKYIINKIENK